MDKVLKTIEEKFIALPPEEVYANNAVLDEILSNITTHMKKTSPLFDALFRDKFYGGSYWDGVKVSKPDEYDVDLKCWLPYTERLEPSNEPGWVNLKFTREKNPHKKKRRVTKPYYGVEGLHVLVNKEDYLDTEKVMLWFHQTLSCALKGTTRRRKRCCHLETRFGIFDLVFIRRGPAFTFHASGTVDDVAVKMDIDIVPCFIFGNEQYPSKGFLPNPCPNRDIFIVCKPINVSNKLSKEERNESFKYWRISFQALERDIIRGKANLKPALRLMKKMRDKQKHTCISSYFIKNLFLCKTKSDDASCFWKEPLSTVFITMLVYYQNCIEKGSIDFYWYTENNLISHIEDKALKRVSSDLQKVISVFQNHPDSRNEIAKCFLTRGEFRSFKDLYKDQN